MNAEAAYFSPTNGHRCMYFIINMNSADMIPKVVELLFQQFGVMLDVIPLMVLDDLKAFSKT